MSTDRFLDTEGLRHLWEKIKAWIPFLSRKTQSIPFGQVDSTSTSTVFTATVDGIDELRDGVCCYLRNGVVTSASGCTLNINGLGAKPIYYTTASATRVTTHYNIAYTWFFVYNSTRVSGGCWDAYWGYDSDSDVTGYNVRQYYHGKKPKTILYRYQFLFTCMDGLLLPVNTVNRSVATNKELTTESFDVFGEVYYYGTTTIIQPNASIGTGNLWSQAAYTLCDLRYSFNTGETLVAGNDVYLVCSPQPDGSVKLAKDPIAFALPNTEDGLLYKRLGKCYDTYRIVLEQHKPVYYYKDGAIRIWANQAVQDVSNKADKVVGATSGNFAGLDATGNLTDSGCKPSDFLTQHQHLPEYTIEKLTQAETSYSASYVLKKDGTQVGATINIPKDMVVSSGEVKTVTTANVPYQGAQVGDKYIDLTIANTSQNHIYIPVKDLVDVYIAGSGINITSNNYISVKVDQNNANGLGVGGSGVSMYVVTPSINGVGGTNGSMLATDKEKLDGIEAGADENVIETVKVSGTALQVTNKAVNIETETAYNPTTNKIATMSDVEGATPNVGHLKTNNTSALTPSASESFTSDINLHKVSKTGSYNDLNDQPTIPSSGDFVTSLGTNGNNVTWTKNGVTNNLTVPYATNAGTAAKLGSSTIGASNRPIYLNAGVPAVTDPGEAFLSWGGRNFSASYGCIDAAMVPELGACRTMFAKAAGIVIEYSVDGGATWLDYGATNVEKVGLFSRGNGFTIGKATKETASAANMLRVTLHTSAAGLYTSLNKFVIFVSKNGSTGTYCTIRCRTQQNYEDNIDTWNILANQVSVNGWPGYNVINFPSTTTYGTTKSTHYGEWQFIFGCTGHNSASYAGLNVSKIFGFGGVGWSTPSTMAKTGHLYSFDASQNAFFPADVTASKFIKSGGTSSQFLKADGSVDSNTYATTSQLPSLPLSIANGGTGATTAKAAEYNLTPNLETEITSEFSDTGRIPCLVSPSNTTNGRFYGYRTMSKVWNYIKSKISSVLGIGGSDGIPTAPTAAAGTNTTQIATTAFVQGEIENKADKVSGATNGDIAGLDSTGNLTDSGYKPSDFINNFYILNGRSALSGINPWSLCAFAISSSGSVMQMSSFTGTSGSGGGAAVTGMLFPIGCKIYYHPDEQFFTASTDFTSKRFYATYDNVNAKYSSNTGSSLNLGTSSSSTVYLRVIIDGNYWKPYHKNAESYENIVTSNQLIDDNFYIYLGKTVGSTGYTIQLEDNNPLYYYDGDDLIDWASYIADVDASSISQDLSGKADKVSNATSGNFAGLDANGNLTDSGHKHSDYLTSHQDISGKEDKTNKVTSLSSSSTDTQYPSAKVVYDQLATKQATLVSGTNIKTVNNTSLLGSGNIQINDGVGFQTITTQQDGTMQITLTNGDTITVDLNHVHPQYYSKVREAVMPQGGFLPDVVYSLGVLSSNTTFSLASMVVGNTNHYYWTFSTATTVITVTWPTRLIWVNGSAPTIAANKHYEISILDNFAVYMETSIQEVN